MIIAMNLVVRVFSQNNDDNSDNYHYDNDNDDDNSDNNNYDPY